MQRPAASRLDTKGVGILLTFCHLWDSATMKPRLEIEAMQRSILQAQNAVVPAAADLWFDGKDGIESIRGPCASFLDAPRVSQSALGGLPNLVPRNSHCRDRAPTIQLYWRRQGGC